LLDACVLYPAPLRDILLQLSTSGLFRARWTDNIHGEWISNLLQKRPDLSLAKLERTKHLMNAAIRDCLVSGYERLMSELDLPDENDRHVLAAAIHCGANGIVTFNLKDFPADILAQHGVEPQHPDDFVDRQFRLDSVAVVNAARSCRARLHAPALSADEYLSVLDRSGLPNSAAQLRDYAKII
jgi:hypothetical protein